MRTLILDLQPGSLRGSATSKINRRVGSRFRTVAMKGADDISLMRLLGGVVFGCFQSCIPDFCTGGGNITEEGIGFTIIPVKI